MTKKKGRDDDEELGLGANPLGDDPRDVLVEHFYKRAPSESAPAAAHAERSAAAVKPKRVRAKGRQPLKDGRTFRLVTFSFYEEDVARLDALLEEAKKLGHKRVSRSQIVRLALRQVDVSELPEVV